MFSCERCGKVSDHPLCPPHEAEQLAEKAEAKAQRPNATDRGYGHKWRMIRAKFLKAYPLCELCRNAAKVADHYPVSRADLIAQGEAHPDRWKHLRPLCEPHHKSETARLQPGGWHKAAIDRRNLRERYTR